MLVWSMLHDSVTWFLPDLYSNCVFLRYTLDISNLFVTFTAALSLPTGKTSVMHLVIREKLPDEHSQGDLLHIVIIVMGFSLAFSFVHFLDFSHHLLTFTRGSYMYRAIILYIYM